MTEAAVKRHPEDEARSRLLCLGDISPPPVIAHELIRLVREDHADIQALVQSVEKSPEVTARILRWANSAYYGERNRIAFVRDAIIRVLGVSTAKSLLLAQALAGTFQTRKIPFFPIERFWFLAVATATLVQIVAQEHCRQKLRLEVVYTAGLIHNFGLLALVTVFPEDLRPVFTADKGKEAIDASISQRVGIEPSVAGGWLGKRWGLPEELIRVMRHQNDSSYEGLHWELVRLVGLVAQVTEYHFDGRSPSDISLLRRADDLIDFDIILSAVGLLDQRFEEMKKFSQLLV